MCLCGEPDEDEMQRLLLELILPSCTNENVHFSSRSRFPSRLLQATSMRTREHSRGEGGC